VVARDTLRDPAGQCQCSESGRLGILSWSGASLRSWPVVGDFNLVAAGRDGTPMERGQDLWI